MEIKEKPGNQEGKEDKVFTGQTEGRIPTVSGEMWVPRRWVRPAILEFNEKRTPGLKRGEGVPTKCRIPRIDHQDNWRE